MADTVLTVVANRIGANIYLSGSVAAVAVDATIAETFFAPQEVGDLAISFARLYTGALSGAYAAPFYLPLGWQLGVVSQDLATYIDHIGTEELLVRTSTTNPGFQVAFKPFFPVLLRRNERLSLVGPDMAGAGVTATIVCEIRARRLAYGEA